ncbi:cobalt-precorrin 5A hydrolase [Franzmannia pantelleriensis]|uniref:Cobalt-precorrin 5A hydrolase n=1 Tax=Franzmannia pantelleriensis TaxID=48727 RepID=A0A1G9WJ55_9GAMM|nr:cobalamin biosynthesis protein [Halomonas pantelleriensis]SDM84489.1 cobalt-precorrin 5A hydrolase [Halomonas pantelleriensis]
MTVAGFGFRRGAQLASLIDALERIEAEYGAVERLAAAESMLPLVQALGRERGMAVIAVDDASLPQAATLTRSEPSLQARGTGSVAEAVALLAAGPGAVLLGPRLISADRMATVAVARISLEAP